MTIHGSKGLEFEAVHLVDIDEKHFRITNDPDLVPESLLQSLRYRENFEEDTEASNKLYVALSRAREHLVLYEKQGGPKARCVDAVTHARHLFEPIDGVATAFKPSQPSATNSSGLQTDACDFPGFLTYMVCPRRYYYDVIKNLKPAAGLHPAALIEGAVMRELFVPHGANPSAPANDVDVVLASLGSAFKDSLPHLRSYADNLLAAGRALLRAQRAPMAKPFQVVCGGLPINVMAHRISSSGNSYTISFVRTKPAGLLARQRSAIQWMLKHLAAAHPSYSVSGRLHVLSTGEVEYLRPDSRTYNSKFPTLAAAGLLAGNFEARTNQYECPKCRHFLHCPA
jgi:hypothetical protein